MLYNRYLPCFLPHVVCLLLLCHAETVPYMQIRLAALYVCRSLISLKKFRSLLLSKENLQTVVEQGIAPGKPLPEPTGAAKDLRALGRGLIDSCAQRYEGESVALKKTFTFVSALSLDRSHLASPRL